MDNIICKLYKYYSDADYNFDALKRGYWFFSKFGHANDPFDCDLSLLNIINNKWKLKVNDIKNGATKDYAICSFSDSYLNKHLWSLYCNSYRGFVVEYEYGEKQYADFSARQLPLLLFDVSYLSKKEIEATNEIPTKQLIPPVEKEMPYDRKKQQEKDDFFVFFYSIKEGLIWGEEHEKRMLIGKYKPPFSTDGFFIDCFCHNGYKVFFPKQSVKKIIAGMNMSEDNLTRLKHIASEIYNINVEQVVKGEPFELKLINNIKN